MLHEIEEVGVKELSPRLLVTGKLLEQVEEDVEAYLCHVSHGVFESPHYRVQEDLELRSWDLEEGWREGGRGKASNCAC